MKIESNGKEYNVTTCKETDFQESMGILSSIDSEDGDEASSAIIEIMNRALQPSATLEEIKEFDAKTITEIILIYFDMPVTPLHTGSSM